MPISQSQLESYLWGAATLLRGYIDAGDYKQFIFPLLFCKRLCDVYDEELVDALEESGGDQEYAALPEQHRFQIPEDAHWKATRTKVKNVGKAIQDALRAIETANPDTLYGVFGDAQWTNKDRLPDHMLRELIEHFSSQTLSLSNCPEDELGVGYEFLIKKFADDSGHTAAEFYTNRTVVHLMTEMLEPKPGESIYDPTCGSAGMLLSAVAHLKRQNKEWRNLRLFGQERNLLTSAIGRMNLFLHGIEDFRIVRGDTLATPAFVEGDQLMQFDVVLANPPYSIKQWDRDAWSADPWGRNIYGTPPQGRADYAFWQHIIKSMKAKSGRCAILFPHGVLFRAEESTMREKLVAHYESVKPPSGNGKLLWHALGAKTIELVHENVHLETVRDDLDTLVMDAEVLEGLLDTTGTDKKSKEIEIKLVARLRKHKDNPLFVALGERLEKLKERHEQGLLHSLDFLKELLTLAKEVVQTEQQVEPVNEQAKAKAALTELFAEVKNGETPMVVERIVTDIDEIVRLVRFPGWQNTKVGEREIQKALRKVIYVKYKIKDQDLFDKAFGYIRQYY